MAETSVSLAAQIRALQARMTTLMAATQERGFDRGYRELDDQREDRVEIGERQDLARLRDRLMAYEPQRQQSRGQEMEV